jgi:hypothetical protein
MTTDGAVTVPLVCPIRLFFRLCFRLAAIGVAAATLATLGKHGEAFELGEKLEASPFGLNAFRMPKGKFFGGLGVSQGWKGKKRMI